VYHGSGMLRGRIRLVMHNLHIYYTLQ